MIRILYTLGGRRLSTKRDTPEAAAELLRWMRHPSKPEGLFLVAWTADTPEEASRLTHLLFPPGGQGDDMPMGRPPASDPPAQYGDPEDEERERRNRLKDPASDREPWMKNDYYGKRRRWPEGN